MKEKIKLQLSLRIDVLYCEHDINKVCRKCLSELSGDVSGLTGNVSGLTGDVTGLSGDVSGLRGDVTEIIKILKEVGKTKEA